MCLTCACGDYDHKHSPVSIDARDLRAAADEAGISPRAAAWNIVRGENAMAAEEEATKSLEGLLSLLKSEEGAVLKADGEHRFLLTVVYSPHRMPLRGADKRTDLVSPEVLEQACWKYAMNGLGTGMWHEEGHADEAVCVENYVYRGPDWSRKDAQGNEVTIKAGDWLAGYILSPRAWDMYKSGAIGGVSMQGAAGRKKASAEAVARVRSGT